MIFFKLLSSPKKATPKIIEVVSFKRTPNFKLNPPKKKAVQQEPEKLEEEHNPVPMPVPVPVVPVTADDAGEYSA